MGNFLKHVNSLGEVPHSVTALTNLSLSKIKELHGSFKSVCDNFAMNLTEYEYIFGGNEAAFAIWDTDNNGKHNAGLILCRYNRVTRTFHGANRACRLKSRR